MKHEHHSVETPGCPPEDDLDVEQWLIKQRKVMREQQHSELPSVVVPVAVTEQGSTHLQLPHKDNRIELDTKTSKTRSPLSKTEQRGTESFLFDHKTLSSLALNEHDLCHVTATTTTIVSESRETTNTSTVAARTSTSTSINPSPEQAQLEPTTLILSVTRADAAAIDADVERAISSILCRDQQQQGNDLFGTCCVADESTFVTVKQIADSNSWKLLSMICFVLITIIGGVTAVTLIMSKSAASESTDSTSSTASPLDNAFNKNVSSLPFVTHAPINTTIGSFFSQFSEVSVTSVGYKYETTQIYLKILDQLDSKFTVVTFPTNQFPGNLDFTLVERYFNPTWNGHTVSTIKLWAVNGLLVPNFILFVPHVIHFMILSSWSSMATLILSLPDIVFVYQVKCTLKPYY